MIVDYLGIASDLKKALSFYSDAGGKGDPTILQEQAVELMLEKMEVVSQLFSNDGGGGLLMKIIFPLIQQTVANFSSRRSYSGLGRR